MRWLVPCCLPEKVSLPRDIQFILSFGWDTHTESNLTLCLISGLWGLVNNAGIVCGAIPSDWMDVDEYHKTLGVNFFGLIDVTMTFLPLIKKAKGRIVNTGAFTDQFSR